MSKRFFVDLIERVVWTALQAGAAVFLLTERFDDTTLKAAGIAAAIAAVKCLASTRIGHEQSAASLPASLD